MSKEIRIPSVPVCEGLQFKHIVSQRRFAPKIYVDKVPTEEPVLGGLLLDASSVDENEVDILEKGIRLGLKWVNEVFGVKEGPYILLNTVSLQDSDLVCFGDKDNKPIELLNPKMKGESLNLIVPAKFIVDCSDIFPSGGIGKESNGVCKSILRINPSFITHTHFITANLVLKRTNDDEKKNVFIIPFPILDIEESGEGEGREKLSRTIFRGIMATDAIYKEWESTYFESLNLMSPGEAFNKASGVGYVALDRLLLEEFQDQCEAVNIANVERKEKNMELLPPPQKPSLLLDENGNENTGNSGVKRMPYYEEEVERWTTTPVFFNGFMRGLLVVGDLSETVFKNSELKDKFDMFRQ